MSKKIIDSSHHHPVIDERLMVENTEVLIWKATQGTSFVDGNLKQTIDICERNKIPYWVFTYLNKGNELAQTKFMIDTCKNLVGNYFVGYVLDVEENNNPANIMEALTYLESISPKCMLYVGWRHYNLYKDVINKRGKNTAWWESRYGEDTDKDTSSRYPAHNGVDLLQYSQYVKVPGYQSAVDGNKIWDTTRFDLNWYKTPVKKGSGKKVKYLRDRVVKIMQSWLGKKESDGSFKTIIDTYNQISPLPQNYKLQYFDEWCAGTVSAAFHEAGYDAICPSECSCRRMIDKASSMGIWVENDGYIPSPGDIIMYDWQDSGVGDNTGWPDHTGIVESVKLGQITIIEGNNNEKVARRILPINAKYIRGFITPRFDEDEIVIADTNLINDWLIMGIAKAKRDMHVRSNPSTNYSSLGVVEKDTELNVIGFSGGWFKVLYKNTIGYTYNGDGNGYVYTRKYYENCKYWATIDNCVELNFRIGPAKSYNNVKEKPVLPKGAAVQVTDGRINKDTGETWYVVNYKGIYGFVHGDYLKR